MLLKPISKKSISIKSMLSSNEKRWILYDFANSVFAVSVVSGFFPILFRKYWASNLESETITLYLGLTNSFISLLLFLLLPYLGYLIDFKAKSQNQWLFVTACVGGVLTTLLFTVEKENYPLALFLYSCSFLFFAFGNTQCDGLLSKVSSSKDLKKLDKLSALGYLWGYIGGGLSLLLQSLLIVFYKPLGFSSPLWPVKIAFLTTGLWWVLFSTPLLKMKINSEKNQGQLFLSECFSFLKNLNKKTIFFLIGFFLYIDVVFTTYKMAVDFGLSLGLSQNNLILVLLYVQFIAAPGTYFMLWISNKYSTQTALFFGIFCYGTVLSLSPFTETIFMFLVLATFIGLAQGGLQSLSRSCFSSLVNEKNQGLGFGFLNVFGKLSAILGPIIVGLSAYAFTHKYSVLSLLPFLAGGAYFLYLSFKENSHQ